MQIVYYVLPLYFIYFNHDSTERSVSSAEQSVRDRGSNKLGG